MNKFERIVREPLVMGGQARIRDTGITVNEIVRLSLDGSSQAEILQKFPMLEAEDVHEALGYSTEYMKNSAIRYIHDVRTATDSIRGFADLLVQQPQSLEDSQKERFLRYIQQHSYWHDYNIAVLNHRIRYLNEDKNIDVSELVYIIGNLPHFCKSIGLLEYILENESNENIKLSAPKIVSLILSFLLRGNIREVHEKKPIVRISSSNLTATFTVRTHNIQYKTWLNSDPLGDDLVFVANLWLYGLGSELKIREEENSVVFEFALPIVEDASG